MHTELIDRYAADADTPARAIEGLTRPDLTAFPVPNTWSIQQIVLHLMDSDLIASDRMKRVIALDLPLIMAYDETAFTRSFFYHDMDIKRACEVFRLNRLNTADLLRKLPDAAWSRTGIHTERGRWSLLEIVQGYTEHLHHHMKFLREKRAKLGKPMAV